MGTQFLFTILISFASENIQFVAHYCHRSRIAGIKRMIILNLLHLPNTGLHSVQVVAVFIEAISAEKVE